MPRYPFSFLLDKRVSIERNTRTKDSSGAQVDGYATVAGYTNLKAGFWSKRLNETEKPLERADGMAEKEWAFEPTVTLIVGDRIVYGSTYYQVVGVPQDFSNDGLAAGPYIVKTHYRVK